MPPTLSNFKKFLFNGISHDELGDCISIYEAKAETAKAIIVRKNQNVKISIGALFNLCFSQKKNITSVTNGTIDAIRIL
jgi:hypothetical protein